MKTFKKYYKVDRKDISYLKFIFEAYDGIAMFSTVKPAAGIIALFIAPGCEDDVTRLLDDLGKKMIIESLDHEELT